MFIHIYPSFLSLHSTLHGMDMAFAVHLRSNAWNVPTNKLIK